MNLIDKSRVAEILVRNEGEAPYGSGYRISTRLILTAAHLLGGASACTVFLGGGDDELPATVAWRADRQDLAVLRLDGELGPVPPITLGGLADGVGSVPFVGIGFPAYALRPDSAVARGLRRRESQQVNGVVQLGSNIKSGLLDLSFNMALPRDAAGGKDAWDGMSGAALFAEDGGALIGVQVSRLPAGGIGRAEAVPIAGALADERFVHLLTGAGIAPRAIPVAVPNPRATEPLRSVVTQHDLIEGFGSFKKNLTPERLPFVSPGSDHPAEPMNLFRRLVAADGRGVLLVGAAGTGKSRAGIEVGRLALDAGWRVLHVLPGESTSVTDQIAEQVRAESSPVLVVIDYLDEAHVDIPALRHRLIPEAHRAGIDVALLASIRPGRLQKANRALLRELFDEVELRQDSTFQQMVTDEGVKTLATTATAELGTDRMLAVCGHRPVIALLVAREIEHRVKNGLFVPETSGLRSGGELSGWLERRLSEDGLTVPARADTFTPAHASPALVAAAAAAAACPQSRTGVTAAAEAALAGAAGPVPTGADIVATLIALGWLEPDGGLLSVAHDVVADQLIESVLLPEHDTAPDRARTRDMLAGCLIDARTVGRFAVGIGRLVNDLALADRGDGVSAVLDGWFADNADTLGDIMRRDCDSGSYALGAICTGPPWSAAVVQCWRRVVDPWLADFGTHIKARHLLYSGLRYLSDDANVGLVSTALGWLHANGRAHEASYVLGPLLSCEGLSADQFDRAISAALLWLDRFPVDADARFVLGPLLSCEGLSADQLNRAISAALLWLDRFPVDADARFVLGRLLSRGDLSADQARDAGVAAFSWLDRYTAHPDARFVLRPLLTRGHLPADQLGRTISLALAWLGEHTELPGASYVLGALLSQDDLSAVNAGLVIRAAFAWLAEHGDRQEASFVLDWLLSRADLSADQARDAGAAAFSWLDRYSADPEAGFVLKPLLSGGHLPPDQLGQAISLALAWLGEYAELPGASYVLGALLSQDDLSAVNAGLVIRAALSWLAEHGALHEANFVLEWLLSRNDLSDDQVERLGAAALTWVEERAVLPEASFVLEKLLYRDVLSAEHRARAIRQAFVWLEHGHNATDADTQFLLGWLLMRIPAGEMPPVMVTLVDSWIRKNVPEQDFVFLSKWVLRKKLMSRTIFEAVIIWANANPDSGDLIDRVSMASGSVGRFLGSRENDYRWLRVVELCLDHAERHGGGASLNGALDVLVCRLAIQTRGDKPPYRDGNPFRDGVSAARADDLIQRWLALPASMDPDVFYRNSQIVYRCHALVLSGRFDRAEARDIAVRLRGWIAQWPRNEKTRPGIEKALAYIDAHMLPGDG